MKTFLRCMLRLVSVAAFAAAVFAVLVGTGTVKLSTDSPDAVSSATSKSITADDMEGKWVVFLNRELHDKSGTTADWEKFFSFDENTPLIMEDITCKVADYDVEGKKIAENYQARLPENQMKIKSEAGVMLLSKAELGRFDVLILSESAAKTYSAETLYDKANVLTIRL